jgi:hypothetical protein
MKWLQRGAGAPLLLLAFLAISYGAGAAELELHVQLDPHTRRLDARAELVSQGDFRFVLHEALTVSRVTANGEPVTPSASGPAERREWRIPSEKAAKLQITYGGTLPELDRTIDHRAVLRRLAPAASSTGTFLPAGTGWYPRPVSTFTYAVTLSLPGDQRGVVAGRLAAESVPSAANERYAARFEFDAPADGIDLMAGPYTIGEMWLPRPKDKPVRLRTYFFKDLEPLSKGYLGDTARYIELYSRQIGAYPFEAFSVVASPLPTGFGMPTLTYIGERVLKLPFIRASSLGHEVLHNWWGNGVYADYARGNWSEGLTTFMADYFYKEQESVAAAREMRHSWLRDFAAVPAGAHRPLTAFRSRTHGAEAAVGYGKAAMVFFMLRDHIGKDSYESGIRLFWEKHRFRTASWADLQRAFEQTSGRPLGTFFAQWIERAGGPRVSVNDARATRAGNGTQLTVTFEQSAPAYALQVPLEIVYDGRTEVRTVAIDQDRQTVSFQLNELPAGVRLDPELRVWRVLERSELPAVLRQWIIARAPRLIITGGGREDSIAARELARSFFEASPREVNVAAINESREPVLIAGLHREVDALLASGGLPPRPQLAEQRGSTEVWTVEQMGKHAPVAVVSAQNGEALRAITRALPHYGSQSYLVFEGPKVVARGVWPAQAPLVRVMH